MTLLLTSCRRDNEDRRPGAIPSKQTTNVIISRQKRTEEYHPLAEKFWVSYNIKNHHKVANINSFLYIFFAVNVRVITLVIQSIRS